MKHHKIILHLDLSESFSRNLIRGLNKYSEVFGPWSFCKMPASFSEAKGIDELLNFSKEWGAQGIIGQFENETDVQAIIDQGLFIIAVDLKEAFNNITNISGDYYESGKMAAEYFLSKGFKNFAFYGTPNVVWSRERERGFRDSLDKNGHTLLSFSPKIIDNHFWYYTPSPLQKWLQSLPKPVAIFACDDNRAEHIVQAAKIAKLHVPEEIGVLGVDNDEVICLYSNPSISSIQQDEEGGGFKAAALMDKMIRQKKTIKEDIILKPLRIITRRSTEFTAITDQYVINTLIYIRENLEKAITVNDLPQVIGLSRRALEKRFLKITGRSIYKEIQRQRVEKVVNLLMETSLSINEIAHISGFSDSKNLARCFYSFHKMTPLKYRKKYQVI